MFGGLVAPAIEVGGGQWITRFGGESMHVPPADPVAQACGAVGVSGGLKESKSGDHGDHRSEGYLVPVGFEAACGLQCAVGIVGCPS